MANGDNGSQLYKDLIIETFPGLGKKFMEVAGQ
jgi:hypothetical protein